MKGNKAMKIITDDLLLFSKGQFTFLKLIRFLHLIKPIEVGGVFHPITRHLECVVQTYKTISVLNPAIKWINEKVIDEYGIAAQNRLMACGVMYEE